jgi:hypothetical protein
MKPKMKLLAAAAILFLLPFTGAAHNDKSKNKHARDTVKKAEHIIEMSSLLTVKGLPTQNYELIVSLDGDMIDTLKVEKAKPIFFDLEPGKLYGLVFKKDGYPDKIVMVDTTIPPTLNKSMYFSADIEIELDVETSTQKKDFIDYPVATFRFDSQKKQFDYSRSYYNTVHKK